MTDSVTVYCPDAIDLDKLLQQSRFIPPIECARTTLMKT